MAAPHDTRVRSDRELPDRELPDKELDAPATYAHSASVRRDRMVENRSWYPTFGPGTFLGALGATGVIVSLLTSWQDAGVHPDRIPVAFLGDSNTTSHDPSMLIALIPIAIVLLVGTLAPIGAGPRLVGGLATLVVAGLFAYQLDQTLAGGTDLGDVLGTGFYVATVGGFLALVSGFAPEAWAARREVVHSHRL